MAERSRKPTQRAREGLSFRAALRAICVAVPLLGIGTLLAGCEQPVGAQTLPVMDAGISVTDTDPIAPDFDAEDPDNTLPNLDPPDIGSPDFNTEDIGGADYDLPNLGPSPTGTPDMQPPTLQHNTPGALDSEQPETHNTPPAPNETPDSETRPTLIQGSGENTPPDFMIRRHPKHA